MAVTVVEVINPVDTSHQVPGSASVTEVVVSTQTPITTQTTESNVAVVEPGGTVANVQWGDTFPPAPVEGQIWIKLT